MLQENYSKVEAIQQHLEAAVYADFAPSLRLIYDEIIQLNAWKAFVGKMMVEAKMELDKKKVELYQLVIADPDTGGKMTSPSILKDYIASRCYDLQLVYGFTERVNSSLGYSIDSLRSILSATKQELATTQYQ